jgi:hypothetical protein
VYVCDVLARRAFPLCLCCLPVQTILLMFVSHIWWRVALARVCSKTFCLNLGSLMPCRFDAFVRLRWSKLVLWTPVSGLLPSCVCPIRYVGVVVISLLWA